MLLLHEWIDCLGSASETNDGPPNKTLLLSIHVHNACRYVCNEDFDKAVSCYRYALRLDDRHYNAWYALELGLVMPRLID